MLVSIITVNLNNQPGLKRTLESVQGQKHTDLQYIIIDGGSKDGSLELIKKNKNHIDYWVSEADNGIYHAMNKGLSKARGEYCLFLNAGDYLKDSATLNSVFSKRRVEDLLIGRMLQTLSAKERLVSISDVTLDILTESSLPHPSTFIKTEFINKVGGFNEELKIVSDWEFFLKALLIENCSYKLLNEVVTVFNMEGISNDSEKRADLMLERDQVKERLLNPIIWQAGYTINELRKGVEPVQSNAPLLRLAKSLKRKLQ
ncbi:MAG: glycosyltransferase family 2 protein [Bacteroidota bacterium]